MEGKTQQGTYFSGRPSLKKGWEASRALGGGPEWAIPGLWDFLLGMYWESDSGHSVIVRLKVGCLGLNPGSGTH